MKLKSYQILFLALLIGCNRTPRQEAVSNLTSYNQELEKLLTDSTKMLDTASVNAKYKENEITSIISNESLMAEISDEASFKELLNTEKDLLSRWQEIPNFKGYSGLKTDTLVKLFRRCATFDRAPANAERVPSARNARTALLSDDVFKAEIPVAFHIIINRKKVGLQGNMANRIRDQIEALNNVYNKSKIKFKLFSIDTTVNNIWFDIHYWEADSTIVKQMTGSLSKNPAQVMNVYVLNSEVLGEATYPWYNSKGTSLDYVIINYNTLFGGPSTFFDGKYTEGKTLVHEAGHYLGLWHTFEGNFSPCFDPANDGCGIGDYVDDTPSQKICYFDGCDENLDSCPAPGKDPVKNFMGYNPDQCMTELTNGQVLRLKQCVFHFRRNTVSSDLL